MSDLIERLNLFRKRFGSGDPLRDFYSEFEMGELILATADRIEVLEKLTKRQVERTGKLTGQVHVLMPGSIIIWSVILFLTGTMPMAIFRVIYRMHPDHCSSMGAPMKISIFPRVQSLP